jgi:small subunit ribosomal protein S4
VSRNTGPVERFSRREGVDLELKGLRRLRGKGALQRRGESPPGQHGRRRRKASLYAEQLRESQKAKRYYGVRERQFRQYVDAASRAGGGTGPAGDQLLALLERRLDNVIVRLGLATTRAQGRQFVGHGHVRVNDRRVDIPSYQVAPGDQIAISPSSPVAALAKEARDLTPVVPPWLASHASGLGGRVMREPLRDEIQVPVDDRLIIEWYQRA